MNKIYLTLLGAFFTMLPCKSKRCLMARFGILCKECMSMKTSKERTQLLFVEIL